MLKNSPKMACKPLKLVIVCHMPIPASYSLRKQKSLIGKPHSKRIDIDNILKFLMDTYNKILWEDDCLIYDIHIKKVYSDNPRTCITLIEDDD